MKRRSPVAERKRTPLVTGMLALAVLVAALIMVFIGWTRMRAAQRAGEPPPVEVEFQPIAAQDMAPAGERVQVASGEAAVESDARTMPASAPDEMVRLVGRVVDTDRRPIAGAEVRYSRYPHYEHLTSSDANGAFQLEIPESDMRGETGLEVFSRAHLGGWVDVGGGSGYVRDVGDIVLEAGGTIAGRVVRPNGTPVEGARVALDRLDVPYSELEGRRRRRESNPAPQWPTATSAADGTFEFVGAPVGRARLAVSARGFLVTFSALIEVRAGCVSSGVVLVLDPFEPEDLIRGVVLAPDGAPVVEAWVSFTASYGGAFDVSDESGRFVLELDAREVGDVLALDRDRGSFAHAPDTPPGAELVLRLKAMRAVPVSVRGEDGAPIASPQVVVNSSDIPGLRLFLVRRDPLHVRVPPVGITATAEAPGFRIAKVGPLDGASVERIEFVLQPAEPPPPRVRVQERVPELEPKVARLDGEFHGQITVDGAAPDGVWTIDLGWRETKDAVGPLERVQLDSAGRFTWSKPALGDQQLKAMIVGSVLDGVVFFDTLHVSAATTEWRRDFKTARVRIDGEFKPKQFTLVWFDASGAWAGRQVAAAGELTFLEGSIKLVGGLDRALQKTPPSTWPALASGEARKGEVLVLRAP